VAEKGRFLLFLPATLVEMVKGGFETRPYASTEDEPAGLDRIRPDRERGSTGN